METSAVLAGAEDRVIDEAVAELERRHTSDEHVEPQMRRRHLRDLFESSSSSACTTVTSSRSSRRSTTRGGSFRAGFALRNVQGEFNVLEEVLWRDVAVTLTGTQRIETLELLNAVLGTGRDAWPEPTWLLPAA